MGGDAAPTRLNSKGYLGSQVEKQQSKFEASRGTLVGSGQSYLYAHKEWIYIFQEIN
jgi:hypothetical protein